MTTAARPGAVRRPPGARGSAGAGIVVRNERLLLGLAGILGFLFAWELGSRAGIVSPLFFSRPTGILAAGAREVQVARFWSDLRASGLEFGIGYALAILAGVPLGLAAGWYRRLQYVLDPWLNFFNSLPRLALLPILLIWFGLGIESKIAVVFLGAFISILIPTIQGVRTVDRRYIDVARSFGASQGRLFTSVVAPSTVPFVLTGLRLGVARALIGVVSGELYGATEGLGVMIARAGQAFRADRLLFGVLIFTLAGIVGVELIGRFERRFQRWRPKAQQRDRR